MGETILFCFVFSSQVLLISWLYPRRVISRGRYVLQNFPPSTHPKLYPYPPESFERWLRNIGRLNLVIFVAGLLIIVGLIPLALRGVRYRPSSARSLLRRNLLIYGLGGIITPFIGIWLVDLLVRLIPGM